MIESVVLVALLAAFVVLLVKKWGIAEYWQIHGNDFVAKLFSCDLCMSFWACVIVSLVATVALGDVRMMAVPFMAMPITRMMV